MPASHTYLTPLDDPAARDVARTGGKAAALAALVAHGLPVVPGFAIHASVEPLTKARRDVARALAGLGGDSFAVRSSATAEDREGASFAGVYDSYLNVRGVDDVLARAADVRASLHAERSRAYAARIGIDLDTQAMAVLVQPLLDASAAGVAFTRDPITGSDARILINAAYGLGEGVVGGSGDVDHFEVDAGASAILERVIATKRTRVIPAAGGGIATVEVDERDAARPALSDGEALAVAALARRVRDAVGHSDIEFAVVEGEAYLLQARPITGLDHDDAEAAPPFPIAWEDPADARFGWRLGSPRPEPVLVREGWARYNAHAARVFRDTGVPMARDNVVHWFNGYRYVRAAEAEPQEMMARRQAIRDRNEALRARGGSVWLDEIEPPTVEIWQRLNRFAQLRRSGDIAARVAHLEDAIEHSSFVMGDLHWRMAASMMGVAGSWPERFAELTGAPTVDSGVLLQALDNRTTRLIRRIRGLARLAQDDAALRAAFEVRDYASIHGRPATTAARRFRDRLRRLLADYGMHTGGGFGSNTRGDEPTWNMDPTLLLETIRPYVAQDLADLERRERAARAERVAAERRYRRQLAGDPEALATFEDALQRARDQVAMMENHNFYMEQGTQGALREAILLVGEALEARGQLDAGRNVNHLTLDEIRAAAADPGYDARPIVHARRAELAEQRRLRPPERIGEGEPPTMLEGMPGEPRPERVGLHGAALYGSAASQGEHAGRARLVQPGQPPPAIEAGEILVGVNAGPDWTPMMPLLGAIVLDQGSVFQHICLVAREYRVPAVINTSEATRVIREGQRLRVDGRNGVVELNPAG